MAQENWRAYWDDCIAKELEPSRRQKVNRVTKALSAKGNFCREVGFSRYAGSRRKSSRQSNIVARSPGRAVGVEGAPLQLLSILLEGGCATTANRQRGRCTSFGSGSRGSDRADGSGAPVARAAGRCNFPDRRNPRHGGARRHLFPRRSRRGRRGSAAQARRRGRGGRTAAVPPG